MVRRYQPKNPYQKWSKLSQRQTTYLLRIYFISSDTEFIAREAQISQRTAREKSRWISDFLLANSACRAAIVDYLSPEIAAFEPVSVHEDFSEGSDFWDRVQTCFFACPAERDASLMLTSLSYLAGLRHIEQLTTKRGQVTMVRNACAPCPAKGVRSGVDIKALVGVKTLLEHDGHRSRRQVRDHFFQAVCRAGVRLRAGSAKDGAEPEAAEQVYRQTTNECARDLATITAFHMSREAVGQSGGSFQNSESLR